MSSDAGRMKPWPQEDRIALNNTEMRFFEKMIALEHLCEKNQHDIEKRVRMVPDGWRDFRAIMALMRRLLADVMSTMKRSQLQNIKMLVENGVLLVNVKGAAKIVGYVVVPVDDMRIIMKAAIENQCYICMKTPSEIKGCRLRKAMESHMPPAEYPEGRCGYMDMDALEE